MSPHAAHKNMAGTAQTRAAYRVVCLFAISAAGVDEVNEDLPATLMGLSIRLSLAERDGGATVVTGGAEPAVRIPPCLHRVGQQHNSGRAAFNPVGYLLRAHHISEAAVTQLPDDLLSHSLLGQFPEDAWNTGNYAAFDATITDTESSTLRRLSVEVLGTTSDIPSNQNSDAPKAFIHLLTWTVVGQDIAHPGRLDEFSI